jgi:tRNA (guanine-N7-)-methyltransferase
MKSGFRIEYISENLHESDFKSNVMTEYEEKFAKQGIPIMFLLASLY